MAEHKYAQVLRWIADGKNIDARIDTDSWGRAKHSDILNFISKGAAAEPDDFRLTPRTIKINGREIEAPLSTATQGQTVYVSDAPGRIHSIQFDSGDVHGCALAHGRLFATSVAAHAAYEAITSLLIGKEAA